MSGTHQYTWEKRQIDIPDVHSRDYNKKTVVNLKGRQSSGARARKELFAEPISRI